MSDPKIKKYMIYEPNTAEMTREFLQNAVIDNNIFEFAVILSTTVIGNVGLYLENDTGEIGWLIKYENQGNGYASEAARGILDFAFNELKLRRVIAHCDANNIASQRVMKKICMRREGFFVKGRRSNAVLGHTFRDVLLYAILAEDYFKEKSPLIGKSATVTTIVSEDNTAKAVGSGSLDVFATPMMIALMERAACECLSSGDEQTSVGTAINIEHTAASPLGAEITASATITAVDGRKIEFEVVASDGKGEIGRGTHTRFIVDGERFMTKASARI
jgi:predicted thioesterase/RimJ/RimL family protein N-acetyltransferase